MKLTSRLSFKNEQDIIDLIVLKGHDTEIRLTVSNETLDLATLLFYYKDSDAQIEGIELPYLFV